MGPHLCTLLMDELFGNKYITLTRSSHPNRNILQFPSKGTKEGRDCACQSFASCCLSVLRLPSLSWQFPHALRTSISLSSMEILVVIGDRSLYPIQHLPSLAGEHTLRSQRWFRGLPGVCGSPAPSIHAPPPPRGCWLSHGISGSRGSSAVLCPWQLATGRHLSWSSDRNCPWFHPPICATDCQLQKCHLKFRASCWALLLALAECSAAVGRNASLLVTDRHWLK